MGKSPGYRGSSSCCSREIAQMAWYCKGDQVARERIVSGNFRFPNDDVGTAFRNDYIRQCSRCATISNRIYGHCNICRTGKLWSAKVFNPNPLDEKLGLPGPGAAQVFATNQVR
ncbi:MAG: hypothetical protein R2792_01560 [Saprospiraceae bacterium]